MGYDYSGYGRSTGSPSVANTLNDISACLEWLYAAGKHPSDIVLYGQSVGSGPSVYLAAATDGIAGLVLHSALASGMRVLNPNWKWWPSWLDVYPNTQLLPKADCPVLVIHVRHSLGTAAPPMLYRTITDKQAGCPAQTVYNGMGE